MDLRGKIGRVPETAMRRASEWLSQGISPRRLALTLALGFAVGCIPVIGVPTLLCAALAFAFRLNFPVIQAANYVAMPLQLLLIVPFVRLGQLLLPSGPGFAPRAFLHLPSLHLAASLSGLAGQALLAWLLVAAPSVLLLTIALTPLLKRIPALNPSEN